MTTADAFDRYKKFLESLTATDVGSLKDHVSEDIRFSDPFHDVQGVDAMASIFDRLFETVTNVQFEVLDHAVDGSLVFFRWRLSANLSGKGWRVEGVTHLTFNAERVVVSHREYWDAASQFYERFPVIGPLLRYLRRRVAGG